MTLFTSIQKGREAVREDKASKVITQNSFIINPFSCISCNLIRKHYLSISQLFIIATGGVYGMVYVRTHHVVIYFILYVYTEIAPVFSHTLYTIRLMN